MADNGIKQGWKTTEFWTSLGGAGLGVAVLLGFFTGEEATGLMGSINEIVGGIMTIASTVGYALSRGSAKVQNINPEMLISVLAGLVEQPEVAKKIKEIAKD